MGEYTLYFKDCLEVFSNLPDNSIDLIIQDPPFGVNFENNKHYKDSEEYVFNNIDNWLKEEERILKNNSHIYTYVPVLQVDKWLSKIREYFTFKNIITLPSHSNISTGNNFKFNTQFIIYASKNKPKKFNKVNFFRTSDDWYHDSRNENPTLYTYEYPSFVPFTYANIRTNAKRKKLHPNEKNIEFIKFLVKISSNKDDLVLDPFCGSGSTIVACLLTGRKSIGIEKNKKWITICERRLKNININNIYGWI